MRRQNTNEKNLEMKYLRDLYKPKLPGVNSHFFYPGKRFKTSDFDAIVYLWFEPYRKYEIRKYEKYEIRKIRKVWKRWKKRLEWVWNKYSLKVLVEYAFKIYDS